MANYILIVDSILNTFSVIDTKDSINFEYSINTRDGSALQNDDIVFIYYKEQDIITQLFTVVHSDPENNKYTFNKIIEKNNSLVISKYENVIKLIKDSMDNSIDLVKIDDDIYKLLKKEIFDNENTQNNFDTNKQETIAPNIFKPTQKILYGVPGSGKSYKINNILKNKKIDKKNTLRVVFHPEYTNADFVGQILPKLENVDGKEIINYTFTPGPFTQILRKAYQNPDNNYALIIEEINRGNAAAIFGELFQLLDRLDEDDSDSYNEVYYTKGWSSYSVNNDCINAYLRGIYDKETKEKLPCIKFTENTGIRLPANLSLLATMNTSDQNVFKLDNAFKRRWALEMIPNKFDLSDDLQRTQCDAEIEGFEFTWGAFNKVINYEIIHNDESETNSFSDKQIGTWFVKNEKDSDDTPIIPLEIFKYKVLEYLWDDVFTEPTTLYTTDYKSFSELLEDIDNNDRDKIFNPKIMEAIDLAQIEINKEKQEAAKQLKLMVAESNFTEEQQQLVNQDFDISKETINDIGRYIRDTLIKLSNENTIVYENFERRNHYITFTTKSMTELLPEIEKPESSWNTTSVYYYWIGFDPNVRGLKIDGHLELGGENIPIETRNKMETIFKRLKPNSEKEITSYNRVAKTKYYDIDAQQLKESTESTVRKIVEDLLKIENKLLDEFKK